MPKSNTNVPVSHKLIKVDGYTVDVDEVEVLMTLTGLDRPDATFMYLISTSQIVSDEIDLNVKPIGRTQVE